MNETKIPYSSISKHAGVSIATVSRGLKNPNLVKAETLNKIHQSIEALGGGEGARLTNSARGKIRILLICPLNSISDVPYFELIRGVKTSAAQFDCQVLLMEESLNKGNMNNIHHLICDANIRGLILVQKVESSILRQLKEKINIIQCDEFNEDNIVPHVTIDNSAAAQKMVHYLITVGCKKIAFINHDVNRYTFAKLRLKGYCDALTQAGLPVDNSRVITLPDSSFHSTVSIITNMLQSQELPDAIFCVSDAVAAAALRACALSDIHVPQDIMVAGFENYDISVMTTPNITTVSQPLYEMGYTACMRLFSMITNPLETPQNCIMDAELVVRESTNVTFL